jgi:hypothetical protein
MLEDEADLWDSWIAMAGLDEKTGNQGGCRETVNSGWFAENCVKTRYAYSNN